MVEKYTKDWRSFGDISETTISANLNFEDADDLIPELPEGYVYDVQMFEKDTDGKEVLIYGEPEMVEEDEEDDIELDASPAIEDADSEDDMDIVLVDKMPDIPEGEEIVVNPEVTLDDDDLDDDDFDFGDEDFDFDDDDFAKGGQVASAIFSPNSKKGKISTSFGDKNIEGLTAMIENDDYSAKEIANAIFVYNEKRDKVKLIMATKT